MTEYVPCNRCGECHNREWPCPDRRPLYVRREEIHRKIDRNLQAMEFCLWFMGVFLAILVVAQIISIV